MQPWDLSYLLREYQEPQTDEDKVIRRKLESVKALWQECKEGERVLAGEIITEFCRIVTILREQQKRQALPPAILATDKRDRRYVCGADLLAAFYDHFKKEEQVSYSETFQYREADRAERKAKLNSTLLDYVARINTFANRYLRELAEPSVIANYGDDILYVYDHIEYLLARFNTKDEMGMPVKQRVNIRSALRKLNEFKCLKENQ